MRVHGATGRVKEETPTTEWATSRDEEQQFGAVKRSTVKMKVHA
jgi:hypothetical protein